MEGSRERDSQADGGADVSLSWPGELPGIEKGRSNDRPLRNRTTGVAAPLWNVEIRTSCRPNQGQPHMVHVRAYIRLRHRRVERVRSYFRRR